VEADMSWGNCNLQASDYLSEIDMDREFSARFKCLYRRDQISDQVGGSAQRAACRPMTGEVREVLALKPDKGGRIDRSEQLSVRQARVQVQVIGNVVRRSADHGNSVAS
jgi:hypothetical protein